MGTRRSPRIINVDLIDLPALPPGGERVFRRALTDALTARAAGRETGLDRPHRRHQPLTKAVLAALAQIDAAADDHAHRRGVGR